MNHYNAVKNNNYKVYVQ